MKKNSETQAFQEHDHQPFSSNLAPTPGVFAEQVRINQLKLAAEARTVSLSRNCQNGNASPHRGCASARAFKQSCAEDIQMLPVRESYHDNYHYANFAAFEKVPIR